MRILVTYLFCVINFIALAQSVSLKEIRVNDFLKVVSDVKDDTIPHGRYLVEYKNHTLIKGRTQDGEMDGIWVSYYMNNQQKVKGRYVKGKKHGEWVYWGKQGEVLAKFQFNHGKRIGHWQGFYEDRKKAIDLVYNPNGNPIQCIQYYQSGIVALNFEYDYKGQDSTSELSYYFENFNIFQYEQRTNKVKDGLYQRYHDNNVLWESYTYSNGLLMQVKETRSKGGMPRKNDRFRDGNGQVITYYPTGNSYSITDYKLGKKNGKVEILDFGGKFSGEGMFENNIPVGKWRIISKFHNQLMTVDFDTIANLVYVNKKTSPAQKEHEEGGILNGYRHGLWQEFDAYGELIADRNYKYGYFDGVQTQYQSQKILKEFSYENGNKSGKFTYYNTFGEVLSEDIYACESELDSNWFKPPIEDWISVANEKSTSNNVRLNFYPPLPAMDLFTYYKSYYDQREYMFLVQRNLGYKYWPRLQPVTFIGGYPAEKEYIHHELIIPEELLSSKVDGSVLLRYKVNEMGIISDITILKSIGLGLDQIAVNLIKAFPPQNPAKFNGIPIESYVLREIDFRF